MRCCLARLMQPAAPIPHLQSHPQLLQAPAALLLELCMMTPGLAAAAMLHAVVFAALQWLAPVLCLRELPPDLKSAFQIAMAGPQPCRQYRLPG